MKSFRAVAGTEHEVIPAEDIDMIFYKIPDLHRVHSDFIRDLQPIVDKWTQDSCIAPQFKILVSVRRICSHPTVGVTLQSRGKKKAVIYNQWMPEMKSSPHLPLLLVNK